MTSRLDHSQDAAYWYIPLARAVPAILLAVVITFSGRHTASLGLVAFGGFAILSGLVVAILNARALPTGALRTVFIVQGAVSVLAGLASVVFVSAGLPFFLVLVSAWAAITGFLELYAGVSSRGIRGSAKDWIFVGAMTAVLAIAVLLVPANLTQHFTGPDKLPGVINAAIVVIGLLGVYAAIQAVFLVIAALSLKWAPAATAEKGEAQ